MEGPAVLGYQKGGDWGKETSTTEGKIDSSKAESKKKEKERPKETTNYVPQTAEGARGQEGGRRREQKNQV